MSNHLISTDDHGLRFNDVVRFEARHVIDVDLSGAEGMPEDADATTIAANVRGVCPCCNGQVHSAAH